MIAQNVAILPPEIKAPPAPLPGGQAIGTFVNHFAAATSANLNTPNNLSGSTALSTSLPWHKLAAKNDNATSNPSPAANQTNQAATPQNNQTPSIPSANANNSNNGATNAANASGTATSASTPALAPTTTIGQIQLAAALGTGTTIQLGSPAQTGTTNQFTVAAGAGNNQPGTSAANAPTTPANAAPASASPTSVSPTQTAANQANTAAVLIAQQAVGSAAGAANTLNQPQGLSALQSSAVQATAAAANQFSPTGPSSTTNQPIGRGLAGTANQLLAAAAASSQNATQATSSNAAQTNAASANTATGAGANTDSNPTHPGAAELNARVVAGATTLIAQSNAAAVSAAKDVLQSNGANAGTALPSSTAVTVPLDKTHIASGIATGGTDGGLATSATGTLNGSIGELRGFAAALTRSNASSRDTTSDLPVDNTQQTAAVGADGSASAPNSSNGVTTTTQPNNTGDTPSSTTIDASVRSNLAAIPVGEQVAIHLKQAAKNGSDEIQIQLKPASLGAIDVKLNVNHDGRLTAVISADRSDTLHLLKQDASSLQQSLRDAGFNADSGSLSFNLRGDAQSFAQNSAQHNSTAALNTALGEDPVAKIASYAPRQHSGTIDIQA